MSTLSVRPVSAQTRIDWADFKRMGTFHPRAAMDKSRWIPAFALNDLQLRTALLRLGNMYLKARLGVNLQLTDWQTLEYKCTDAALNYGDQGGLCKYSASLVKVRRESVIRAGGYLALHGAVAYRYWRLGQSCIAVAEALGITPSNVRQIAHQVVRHARELGFETYAPHWTNGKKYTGRAGEKRQAARHATLSRRFKEEDFGPAGKLRHIGGRGTRDLVLIEMGRWNNRESSSLRVAFMRSKDPEKKAKWAALLEAKNREIAAFTGYSECSSCHRRPIYFAWSYTRCADCLGPNACNTAKGFRGEECRP